MPRAGVTDPDPNSHSGVEPDRTLTPTAVSLGTEEQLKDALTVILSLVTIKIASQQERERRVGCSESISKCFALSLLTARMEPDRAGEIVTPLTVVSSP